MKSRWQWQVTVTIVLALILVPLVQAQFSGSGTQGTVGIEGKDYGEFCTLNTTCNSNVCRTSITACGCLTESDCPSNLLNCVPFNYTCYNSVITDYPDPLDPSTNSTIDGSYFSENANVTLWIQNSTNSIVTGPLNITTNATGGFTYLWITISQPADIYTYFVNDSVDSSLNQNGTIEIKNPYYFIGRIINSQNGTTPSTVLVYDEFNNLVKTEDENYSITLLYGIEYDIHVTPTNFTGNGGYVLNDTVFQSILNEGNASDILGLDEAPINSSNYLEWEYLVGVEPLISSYSSLDLTFIHPATSLAFYKCTTWNFTGENCPGESWTNLVNGTSGTQTTISLGPGDPGIGITKYIPPPPAPPTPTPGGPLRIIGGIPFKEIPPIYIEIQGITKIDEWLTIRATDEAGNPLANVTFIITDSFGEETDIIDDRDGTVQYYTTLIGPLTILASKDSYTDNQAVIEIEKKSLDLEVNKLSFKINETATITVIDEYDNLIRDANIKIRTPEYEYLSKFSDENGQVTAFIDKGGFWKVTAEKYGYNSDTTFFVSELFIIVVPFKLPWDLILPPALLLLILFLLWTRTVVVIKTISCQTQKSANVELDVINVSKHVPRVGTNLLVIDRIPADSEILNITISDPQTGEIDKITKIIKHPKFKDLELGILRGNNTILIEEENKLIFVLKEDKEFTELKSGKARIIKYTVKTEHLPKYKASAKYTIRLDSQSKDLEQ